MKQLPRLEGSGASKILSAIKFAGHNVDVNFEIATVVSAPPEIKVKLAGGITLEKGDLVIAEHLTKHVRVIKTSSSLSFEGLTPSYLEFQEGLSVGDNVILASYDENQSYIIIDKAVVY